MIGRVVSTKMTKTVAVLVERIAKHPLYKKTYSQSRKYLVDDPIGVKMGDLVEIAKVKPISRNKHWRITKVVGKNLEEITTNVLKEAAEKVIAEVMPVEKEGDRVEGISKASLSAKGRNVGSSEEEKVDKKEKTKLKKEKK